MNNYSTTGFLNLRKEPKKVAGNVLLVLPPDTIVEKTGFSGNWFQVKAVIGGVIVTGYASSDFLIPSDDELPSVLPLSTIPRVDYPAGNKNINLNDTARICPLNEPGLIKADLSTITTVNERSTTIHNIINFLSVEKSARYAPGSGHTYCNIYAYDVAYCTGAYLPRVWWTNDAITKIKTGNIPAVKYAVSVSEYTANMITDWFEKYGQSFKWDRVFNLTELQNEVNKGKLGIIVAQRINMNNPGHIVAVVPETETLHAIRNGSEVTSPLQSQAGSSNKKYFTGYKWWEDTTRFKKFGFWIWPGEE